MSEPTSEHLVRLAGLCEGLDARRLGELRERVLKFVGPNVHHLSLDTQDKLRGIWEESGCQGDWDLSLLRQGGRLGGFWYDDVKKSGVGEGTMAVAILMIIAWFIKRAMARGEEAAQREAARGEEAAQREARGEARGDEARGDEAAQREAIRKAKREAAQREAAQREAAIRNVRGDEAKSETPRDERETIIPIYHQNSYLDYNPNSSIINSVCGAYSALYALYIVLGKDWTPLNVVIDVTDETNPVVQQIKALQNYFPYDDNKSPDGSTWWSGTSNTTALVGAILNTAVNNVGGLGELYELPFYNTVYEEKYGEHKSNLLELLTTNATLNYIILITLTDNIKRQGLTIAIAHRSNGPIFIIDTHLRLNNGKFVSLGESDVKTEVTSNRGILAQYPTPETAAGFFNTHYLQSGYTPTYHLITITPFT